jgi:hypothetical protein
MSDMRRDMMVGALVVSEQPTTSTSNNPRTRRLGIEASFLARAGRASDGR